MRRRQCPSGMDWCPRSRISSPLCSQQRAVDLDNELGDREVSVNDDKERRTSFFVVQTTAPRRREWDGCGVGDQGGHVTWCTPNVTSVYCEKRALMDGVEISDKFRHRNQVVATCWDAVQISGMAQRAHVRQQRPNTATCAHLTAKNPKSHTTFWHTRVREKSTKHKRVWMENGGRYRPSL